MCDDLSMDMDCIWRNIGSVSIERKGINEDPTFVTWMDAGTDSETEVEDAYDKSESLSVTNSPNARSLKLYSSPSSLTDNESIDSSKSFVKCLETSATLFLDTVTPLPHSSFESPSAAEYVKKRSMTALSCLEENTEDILEKADQCQELKYHISKSYSDELTHLFDGIPESNSMSENDTSSALCPSTAILSNHMPTNTTVHDLGEHVVTVSAPSKSLRFCDHKLVYTIEDCWTMNYLYYEAERERGETKHLADAELSDVDEDEEAILYYGSEEAINNSLINSSNAVLMADIN